MKVSIITPVYNGESVIVFAIESVLGQTCSDWEWIIVNDGSNDGTAEILNSLRDSRIKVIHQKNKGVSSARNSGLDVAQGKYVTFLDADDYLPPDALKLRCDYLDFHPEVDIVNGSVDVISRGKLQRRYVPDVEIMPLFTRLVRLDQRFFFSVNYMLRRSKIGAERFPVGISHCEDIIFFLLLASQSPGLMYGAVKDVVYTYCIQPDSAMANLDGIENGYLELLRVTKKIPRVRSGSRNYQCYKVTRIMFGEWVKRKRPLRALLSFFKIFRVFFFNK